MFRKRPYSTAIAMLLAIIVLTGFIYGEHMRTIHTYIGQGVLEFDAENGHPIYNGMDDDSPFIFPHNDLSEERFHFIYGKPGEEIHFPPARLIWINQDAGVVTNILLNTSAQKETLDRVYGEMSALGEEFAKAGWHAGTPMPTLVTIKRDIATSQGTTNGFGAQAYTKGTSKATILLSTPGAVITPETVSKPMFVAEIRIHDIPFENMQADKTFAARKQVKGNEGINLPLSYWVKLPK